MTVELTPAERDQLSAVIGVIANYLIDNDLPPAEGFVAVDQLRLVLEDIITARMADAWRDGYREGWSDRAHASDPRRRNPYLTPDLLGKEEE